MKSSFNNLINSFYTVWCELPIDSELHLNYLFGTFIFNCANVLTERIFNYLTKGFCFSDVWSEFPLECELHYCN